MIKKLYNFSLDIDINIEEAEWLTHLFSVKELIYEIAYSTIENIALAKHLNNIEFSVTLTDNAQIRLLNKKYRNHDKATNVLSFPMHEIAPESDANIEAHHQDFILLGDIILALSVIKQESVEQGKPFLAHFSHLLVHGILHLMGYDHDTDVTAEKMEKLEIAVLSNFDIQSPYMYNK